MARQRLPLLLIALTRLIPRPQLQQIITPSRHKPPHTPLVRTRSTAHQASRCSARSPGHRIDTNTVCGEDLVVHGIVGKFENGDIAVGRGAGEQTAGFVGGPGDDVDGGRVHGKVEDFGPGGALFAPDEYFAVVAGGGEDGAEFGVGPGDAPDCSFVAVDMVLADLDMG